MAFNLEKDQNLESWIWDVACSIRGAKDAPRFKEFIGKSQKFLIRRFGEGGGQSSEEFYTPGDVGKILSRVPQLQPGIEIYNPSCC